LVQSAVRDAHAPYEFVDISDLFLMGFSSKDDRRTPRAKTWANPTVVKKDLNLGHDDLALMRTIRKRMENRLCTRPTYRGAFYACDSNVIVLKRCDRVHNMHDDEETVTRSKRPADLTTI
jgi:hypothetical protein